MTEIMARRGIAVASALLLWSALAGAAVVELRPFAADTSLDELEVLEAPGRLALWARAPSPTLLELDAASLRADPIPMPAPFEHVELLGNTYVGKQSQPQLGGASTLSLVRFDRRGDILGVLYATRNDSYALTFRVALDHSAIYVTEQIGGNRSKLTRIAADGRLQWQRDLVGTVLDAVALPDGLLTRSSSNRLALITPEGNTRWTKQLPRETAELVFVPPDRVGIRNRPSREHWTLSLLQTDNGELTHQLDIPRAGNLRATSQGLLLHGTLAHYPFLMLIDHDGVTRWTSRFRISGERAALSDALLTSDGRILVTGVRNIGGANRTLAERRAPVVLLASDIGELIDRSSACLGTDGLEIDLLELELYRQQALELRPVLDQYARSVEGREPCVGPTDAQYLQLLRGVKQHPAALQAPAQPDQLRFFVNVVMDGPPLELKHYTFDTVASDVPRTSLALDVTVDAAAILQRTLEQNIRPHLQRMRRYQEQFKALTGAQFTVQQLDPQQLADPALLEELERSARTVVSSMAALPPRRRAALKSNRNHAVVAQLAPGKFGSPIDMRDAEAAPAILQQMVDEARRQAR